MFPEKKPNKQQLICMFNVEHGYCRIWRVFSQLYIPFPHIPIPFDEFNNYLLKADIIITHGGVGSILNALKLKKKVIAVPRLAKYGEHINDHQLQVIKKMTEQGYILSTEDENKIAEKIKEAENFEVEEYTSNTENFIQSFKQVLDSVLED